WAAERDGDHIYGIVRATAINHGGKTNSYSVPNPNAQGSVIHTAIAAAGIDARAISYIEAHGTGTALGDPIEVAGLSQAFRTFTDARQFCAIGSVKSNIGHCESAAGISGITKVLLQMRHQELVPSLHATMLNPYIDFENSPFVVQRERGYWKRPQIERDGAVIEYPRIAGISSFGAGGANAHAIIEEYVPQAADVRASDDGAVAIVLSARSDERLVASAARLLAAVPALRGAGHRLRDLAYTLQVGREAMQARLAIAVASLDELETALAQVVAGRPGADAVHRGHVQRDDDTVAAFSGDGDLAATVAKWLAQRRYDKLLPLWVKGLDLDWAGLYQGQAPRRLSLPTYPFEARRYWVPGLEADVPAPALVRQERLHPLLHKNVSTFAGQCFSSLFDGREAFLTDHVVHGRPTLPAVAYLEMAHAAFRVASPGHGQALCLSDVVWAEPLVVEGGAREVRVSLERADAGEARFEVFSDEAGQPRRVHGQGAIGRADLESAPAVSIAALRQQCGEGRIEAAALYARFAQMGIVYGPSHRAIEELWSGAGQVLARLSLPAVPEQGPDACVLHPGMMDAALQAALGLTMGEAAAPQAALVPFAIERVDVFGPCTAQMYALVRLRNPDGAAVRLLDALLYDADGSLRVRVHGLASRPMQAQPVPAPQAQAQSVAPALPQDEEGFVTSLLAPCWEACPLPAGAMLPAAHEHVGVVGGSAEQHAAIAQRYRHTHVMRRDADEDVESIVQKLANLPALDHVIWIAPDSDPGLAHAEQLIGDQERGVLQCFRLAKALLQAGYEERDLGWTFITVLAQALHAGQHVRPSFAAVAGFAGSLAKERAHWRIRVLDLEEDGAWPLADMFQVPADANGDVWAQRGSLWYRHVLLPSVPGASEVQLYREGGVYVVIGGAGGIGVSWSEWMMRRFNARIVWIGRKPIDAAIQSSIDRLARFGVAPVYIAADAGDPQALADAHAQIKRRYGQINGLVHSAIVLADQSIARMSEARFRAGLAAKVDVSVNMARVFGAEPLDVVLFFSSMVSFSKAAGQSNYAAGCSFKDAFARRLGADWPCAVKVMNWGFWGAVGAVAAPAYQQRMESLGVGSLDSEEAMEALAALVNGPADQLALIKTTRDLAIDGLDRSAFVRAAPRGRPSLIRRVRDHAYTRPERSGGVARAPSAGAAAASQPLNDNADFVE
ncbi:MAG: SDR family NAD(P)-dependent oxidoreductase, partial [Gammaproteobacteria bacterium]